jgi:hypothetical protein
MRGHSFFTESPCSHLTKGGTPLRTECGHGHPLRGPADYFPNGDCRHCDKNRVAKYKARRRAMMEFAREFERAGQLDLSAYVTPPAAWTDDD